MAHELHTLATGGGFFEGPRWHDGRWWVSDFYRHQVLAVGEDGTTEVVVEVPGQPSGLGWLPDGRLLVASMKDRSLFVVDDGALSLVADLTAVCGGSVNDMVVDTAGRAYVGDFGFDLMAGGAPAGTTLKRVDPDGTVTLVADDLQFPNGAVITPDGSTLIVGETMARRYTAFTIEADGSLTGRRTWADLSARSVLPDGCGLDADGRIWCADAGSGHVLLVAEGGDVLDDVAPPEGLNAYACMLGGADGRTLVLCCAPDYFEHERSVKREAVLVTTEVAVGRAGRP